MVGVCCILASALHQHAVCTESLFQVQYSRVIKHCDAVLVDHMPGLRAGQVHAMLHTSHTGILTGGSIAHGALAGL